MPEAASLYLVPTPIGNLGDITIRALEVLKTVDWILAEDTRTSKPLLNHYDIITKTQPYHQHNEHKVVETLIRRMQEGRTFALITDAGSPGISDPGFLIIRECLKNNIKIECLPGATAFVPALVKSGLPTDRFCFEGFIPQKKGRETLLKSLVDEERTMVFYESPFRLLKTLDDFVKYFGPDRLASVSRELTKIYEETKNGTLAQVLKYFTNKIVKGEIVIVVSGKTYSQKAQQQNEPTEKTDG